MCRLAALRHGNLIGTIEVLCFGGSGAYVSATTCCRHAPAALLHTLHVDGFGSVRGQCIFSQQHLDKHCRKRLAAMHREVHDRDVQWMLACRQSIEVTGKLVSCVLC